MTTSHRLFAADTLNDNITQELNFVIDKQKLAGFLLALDRCYIELDFKSVFRC